jgi:hypothetical protein
MNTWRLQEEVPEKINQKCNRTAKVLGTRTRKDKVTNRDTR